MDTPIAHPEPTPPERRRRGPFAWALDLFSSVWLGVSVITVLFFYCSIGSAKPTIRQSSWAEMTEFEWFHWWPFNVLVLLLCLNLTVVTVRRIPFRLVNLGVWAIHGGIITLCLGSYLYFGTKIEGDTPVFRRRVSITLPGMVEPVTMVAVPGSQAFAVSGSDRWRFEVQSTNSDWPILSEPHKGERTYAVNVLVTPPTGEPFIRQLLDGFPQYTEDVIPGKGRAIKSIGRKLVREELSLTLEYEPQKYFHVMDTWALFSRRAGETAWVQRPIRGLPRYHDRIASREQVFTDANHAIAIQPIDLEVDASPEGDALGSATVRVTGYLTYARMQRRWRDGGAQPNPVLRLSILADGAPAASHQLVAFDRQRNHSEDGIVEFRWLKAFSQVDALPMDAAAVLHISVPGKKATQAVPLNRQTVVGPTGVFTPIEGTEFSYRIRAVQDNLVLPGAGRMVSVAMVDVRTPEGRFTRMVADQPGMTRDMPGESADPHAPTVRTPKESDPRVVMTYQPASAPIIFAAYPGGLFLVINGPAGRVLGRDVLPGQVVEVDQGIQVRVDELLTHAFTEVKPYIVPESARRKGAGAFFSMIRLEVDSGRGTESLWLPFNRYAFPNAQYSYGGAYQPRPIRLSDGSDVEVLFSRQRRLLPSPIALERFSLDTHVGGFSGNAITIRNYISELRFLDDAGWTEPTAIQVNDPTEHGGYWYFQSNWDKPAAGGPGSGMNFTGLGVGNRNGVYIQLAGCCLSVLGMLFAFYVKPVIQRRRYDRSRGKLAGAARPGDTRITEQAPPETVEV